MRIFEEEVAVARIVDPAFGTIGRLQEIDREPSFRDRRGHILHESPPIGDVECPCLAEHAKRLMRRHYGQLMVSVVQLFGVYRQLTGPR